MNDLLPIPSLTNLTLEVINMPAAMILGAHGGIGRQLACLLKQQGWFVIGVSRHPYAVATYTDVSLNADVSDPVAIQQAVYTAAMEVEAVDLWAYAVGDIVQARVTDMLPLEWKRIWDANLTGAYLTTRASLPFLTQDAHLFYLGALTERLNRTLLSAYVASKAGLETFVTALAREQRRRRVTLVRPTAVDTPLWDKVHFHKPGQILTPQVVAAHIWHAYQTQHSGVLDILPDAASTPLPTTRADQAAILAPVD